MGRFYSQEMKWPLARKGPALPGFTLIELLVAVAILGIILLMLLQISEHTFRAVRSSHQQMDATQKTRIVLDVIAADLENLVAKNGFTLFAKQNGGDTQIVFVSRSRGPAGASDFRQIAVAYALEGNEMVRRTGEITWADTNLVSKTIQVAASGGRTVLASGILRFEVVAGLDDGSLVPLATTMKPTLFGEAVPDGFSALEIEANGTNRPAASLVVAVAAVDDQNLRLPGAANAGALLPSPSTNQTPLEAWENAIADGSLESIAPPVRQALQTAQESLQIH